MGLNHYATGWAFYAGTAFSGVALGYIFIVIWRAIVPRTSSKQFWQALGHCSKNVLADEHDNFHILCGELAALLKTMIVYVARNFAGLLLGALPAIGFIAWIYPPPPLDYLEVLFTVTYGLSMSIAYVLHKGRA